MLHACVQKFDVTGNLEKFWELNKALVCGLLLRIYNLGKMSDCMTLVVCFMIL